MDKDFDFDNIGKQTPYHTSDNFFEEVQQKVMKQTGIVRRRKRRRLQMVVATTFAAAAVLAGLLFVPSFLPVDSPLSDTNVLAIDNVTLSIDPVDNWIKNLSDEELEELVSFSENDIFLN
ncbi:hypothetical protein [Bacteroides faecalis]|uniref:Uncharacterized protein n=1 Tax=Bacteroides faecalis TaxID=2447885 RepID=A0A401LU15_9BACE|nr:hypothetical protein [Bacteroides faecalis]GCB34994.1 hypothetical protein KGMB02408_19390 [Bacteroides faecalis]GCB37290.1 hypothetical protein KGMB02408_42350 [Bacteroides faecalis]